MVLGVCICRFGFVSMWLLLGLLFFLREATSESYGPRGLVSIILLLILFAFAFDLKILDLNHLSLCNNFPSPFQSFMGLGQEPKLRPNEAVGGSV